MRISCPIALSGFILICSFSAAGAQDFRVEDVTGFRDLEVAQLAPGTIAVSDDQKSAGGDATKLIGFQEWVRTQPEQKKFLSLFPSYAEPTVTKVASAGAVRAPVTEKLTMYVARARFIINRSPGAIDLSHYVTLAFLEKIDPAIKHKELAAADINAFKDRQGTGNANPDRKWCTGRPSLVCVESSYRLEGKIPMGIMLVNKLRDSPKKVSDHIDFESELSQPAPADVDQAGLKDLTGLDAPVTGVLEQNIFYVNQIMKFGKLFAVFQNYPGDTGKTVVSAYMALAVETSVLDKQKEFENVPVLRNLVPAKVLMGQSSFNSGDSISAGLPKYARNEIRMVAGLLARDK